MFFLHNQYIVTVFLLCLSGSQAVVSLLLQRELSSEPFSLVAEEVNKNFMYMSLSHYLSWVFHVLSLSHIVYVYRTQRIYARMVLRIFSSASLNSSTTLWLLRIYSNPLTLLYQQMIFSEPLTVALPKVVLTVGTGSWIPLMALKGKSF